ncbi:hypothetical protein N7468_003624 [Penicillium chermesinum]|uniref:Zn(2)-C6 fungal-type domain-containing protein n=1 Tax=Penicillium chermesinum TaxID=63820 RepID=A0A9W9TRS8_9EURO|nr:uncharacterized protein N7468_003624 [Penicillium chermesinum]KAJ5239005.1 hypothetical protein N7468_003624 [Penicillium chermesinum]
MGRPKVDPANRLRANTACTACRASKKRCSGSFPCTSCIQKGRARTCIPFKSSISEASPRNALARESLPPWEESQQVLNSPLSSQIHAPSSSGRGPEQPMQGSRSPEATHRTHPRMLRNLQGDRVYVGKAASLSFLQLVRETVTQHIGPSQFSHPLGREDMLEAEATHDPSSYAEENCSPEDQERLVRSYRIATSGFLHLGHDVTDDMAGFTEPKTERESTRAAIKDLMLAIGAQSYPNDPDTVQMRLFFFTRGQRRAFASFLEDPSINLIRVFLLMSFYMFGACRRNTAFMYLGVAARSAVALGLYEDSAGCSWQEQRDRSSLWMSLCVIDLIASSILGRPAATAAVIPGQRPDPNLFGSSPAETSLGASFQLSLILSEIIGRLYSEKGASSEIAEVLLRQLKHWSDNLPDSLRRSSVADEEATITQERIISNMHVACSYHFAVILVTRPFLISLLSIRLAQLHQTLAITTQDESISDPAQSRLAAACIDSAVYMLQTCIEVHQTGYLLRNMAILKAFIFAAALVLGFTMFAHREIDSDVESAFKGALVILRMLAAQSAQAAHYLEILTLLEAAIVQQRQRLAAHARQRRSQYVSRIFSLHDSPKAPRDQGPEQVRPDPSTPLSMPSGSYPWIPQDGL